MSEQTTAPTTAPTTAAHAANPAPAAATTGNAEADQMAFLVAQMLQQMQGKFEQMSGAILGRSLSLPFPHIIHLTVFFTFL